MRSMRRREGKPKVAPPADLLVCFPARAHLTLMPKPVCSPSRASDSKRHHLLKKSTTRNSQTATQASPLLWAKTKPLGGGEMTSEPTSPKVTCAGQIKIKPKSTRSRKTWQSVVEEIERIHDHRKHKKKPTGGDSLGFKREIVHFLSCLRSIRFGFRCFRGFPAPDVTTEDEYDDVEEEEEDEEGSSEASRTVFSKWFMVLQEEDQDGELCKQTREEKSKPSDVLSSVEAPTAPPPNALLLMRCRSAPAKSWLQEKPEQEKEEEEEEDEKTKISLKVLMEEEKEVIKRDESLVVMNYDTDFYKLSSDIAKETWVVSGSSRNNDPLVRSRSWKRW